MKDLHWLRQKFYKLQSDNDLKNQKIKIYIDVYETVQKIGL